MVDFANQQAQHPPPALGRSAVDAIGPTWTHMVKVLFRPFRSLKWLKFGLVAFLISLAGGGGAPRFNINLPLKGEEPFSQMDLQAITKVSEWVQTHLTLIIILGVVAILVVTTIWTLFIYFSSRFTFVYIEGVLKNDLQIKRAYKENRINGWSYFLWRIIFMPTALLVILLLIGVPAIIVLFIAQDKGPTLAVILVLILLALLFIALCIVLIIIGEFTFDFVVPIMYLMKIRVLKAWKVLLGLMRYNKAQFFLYIIMRMLLGSGALMLLIIPCCFLGCIVLLPSLLIGLLGLLVLKYPLLCIGLVPAILIIWVIANILWETIILPITVFFRTYPLVFLKGFALFGEKVSI